MSKEDKKDYRTYFGKRFYKNSKGYWHNPMPIHAHRWVWINHHGAIPEKMDIHHIDGNKDNNEIENLEMISRSDHLKRHWQEGRFDLDQRRKQLAEARTWLRTPEGRKTQSQNTKNSWEKRKLEPPQWEIQCKGCGTNFKTRQKWAKWCNQACFRKWKWKNKISFVDKKCWICGNVFFNHKFSRVRTCGKECGIKLQVLKQSAPIEEEKNELFSSTLEQCVRTESG